MGTSTAWHLRRLGLEDVVVVEREALASGSTGKAAGGIRTQFADELNIRIALRSMAEFEQMLHREPGTLRVIDRHRGRSFVADQQIDEYRGNVLILQQVHYVPTDSADDDAPIQ